MIIVSDTGPLAYLVEIGVADFLPKLYGQVYIPPVVFAELTHAKSPAASWADNSPDWLQIVALRIVPVVPDLDLGEQQAIALALELGADRLLIDEKQGRDVAKARGLNVAGTLAVIVDGAKHGLFDGQAALNLLARTTFYASPQLLDAVRKLLD